MKINCGLSLLAFSFMLVGYSLPAAAEANVPLSVPGNATQKIYQGDTGKSGPVLEQDTIDLSDSRDT